MTTLFTVEAKLSVRRLPCRRFRNQHIGRDAQAFMQSTDHGQRQRALAAQDFVDAVAFANDRLKISDGQTALIHPEFDGFHRIWRGDGHVLGLVGLP